MDDYSFLADLLSTYRSSPDAVKILLALTPLVTVCGGIWLAWFALRDRFTRSGAVGGEAIATASGTVSILPPIQDSEALHAQKVASVERLLLSLRQIEHDASSTMR